LDERERSSSLEATLCNKQVAVAKVEDYSPELEGSMVHPLGNRGKELNDQYFCLFLIQKLELHLQAYHFP
jgi:hypothetical protein